MGNPDLFEIFERHVRTLGLQDAAAPWVVGYSGGADSTCLIHLLSRLESRPQVIAAHLHHGQRPEADEELTKCEKFAREIGLEFLSGKADVPGVAAAMKIGLEEAGRIVRKNFFGQILAQTGGTLLLGHTLSDQAETVLFNLVRGAGTKGLAGMRQRTRDTLRPLMNFRREQTRAYCDLFGLWYHDDPSNVDVGFARARIRLNVIPELERVHTGAEEAIVRAAKIMEREGDLLDGMAAAALEKCELKLNGELGFISRACETAFRFSDLNHLPQALLARAIRLAAGAIGGRPSFDQVSAIEAALSSQGKGSVTFEGGEVCAEWSEEVLHFRQINPILPMRSVIGAGELESEQFGWRISVEQKNNPKIPVLRAQLTTCADADKLQGELYLRGIAPGDRIQPLGFDGHRKVIDLMAEAKLSTTARKLLPVVCDFVGPIWVPGICVSERIVAKENARSILVLRFEPIN